MKKFIVSILAILYMGSSTGATIHMHYCMGKLVSWGLQKQESKKCSFCGMTKKHVTQQGFAAKNECCKDDFKQVKADNDQKVSSPALQFSKLFTEGTAQHQPAFQSIYVPSFTIQYPTAHAPPRTGTVPVFLYHCHFRI